MVDIDYDFLKDQLVNKKRSIVTALRRLSSTKQFFLFLKREGYFKGEIPPIDTPKRPERLPECLSEEEITKMENGEGAIKQEDLKNYFGEIYTTLLDKSGLNKIKLKELSGKRVKNDFKPLLIKGKDSPYPREKTGLIRFFT